MVEIVEIEHLQVHPFGARLTPLLQHGSPSAGVPQTTVGAQLVDFPADGRGTAPDLGLVLPDADHQREPSR